MKRILLTISYDGANFFGWQKQNEETRTVQGELEKAIEIISGEHCEVYGSGRTDAGVHALISRLADVLNNLLPGDIAITNVEEVAPSFHARFSIKKKCYRYVINASKIKDPFLASRMAFVKYPLDEEKMLKAASLIEGEHDFQGFCSAATCTDDFVRKVYSIKITKEDELYYFDVEGNGFLYNMVRIIVGTLVDVGRGKLSLESVKEALEFGDRSKAGVTMPAGGLYLKYTKY